MRKRVYGLWSIVYSLLVLQAGLIYLSPSLGYAQPVSAAELMHNAREYDGKVIIFEGEVIGEVMHRHGGAWVNLRDRDYAIGVWMKPEHAALIEYAGSYKTIGDTLRIQGRFNHACIDHAGALDIHALSVEKISPGGLRQEQVNPQRLRNLFILAGVLCLILILRILISK